MRQYRGQRPGGLIPAHAGKTTQGGLRPIQGQAHPRSRGENRDHEDSPPPRRGSSPLTRGKHGLGLGLVGCEGLIPAHAGKTGSSGVVMMVGPAHPRSRGENAASDEKPARGRGSSPLTRGKLQHGRVGHDGGGLIPAHAGKTPRRREHPSRLRAHPRSRGENGQASAAYFATQGSSPLTRGKPRSRYSALCGTGLIPAHAGKTPGNGLGVSGEGAHPRSRGENSCRWGGTSAYRGSSPLTRGKRGRFGYIRAAPRLIPAHAGKTNYAALGPRRSGAHPRSRGENAREDAGIPWFKGSSPLTRGKLPGRTATALHGRLIPAHAGKTGASRAPCDLEGAHPRSRGENTS